MLVNSMLDGLMGVVVGKGGGGGGDAVASSFTGLTEFILAWGQWVCVCNTAQGYVCECVYVTQLRVMCVSVCM